MLTQLIEKISAEIFQSPSLCTVEEVGSLMRSLRPHVRHLQLSDRVVPYGRYLLHHDADCRFNVQLMAYSAGYVGRPHCHDTWGMFFALRGGLFVDDYEHREGQIRNIRHGFLGAGACHAFGRHHDWHRVAAPKRGPQTVSLHIYGPEFNLDAGVYMDENLQPICAARGSFANPSSLEQLFDTELN